VTPHSTRLLFASIQLLALAELLSLEEVTEQFSDLSTFAQVCIFGLFDDGLADIRAALTRTVAHE
jgi:hypothetical protein